MRTANRRPGDDAWLDQKMQLIFLRRKVASFCRETLAALERAPLHPAAAEQHRDAALNAGAESLALLEFFTAFQSVLLGRLVSSALRNGDLGDSALFAGLYILGAEEAAIRRVQFRRVAEGLPVTIQ